MPTTTAVDPARLDAFMGKAVVDLGAAVSSVLCMLGERLGLYEAMAGAGPLTPNELAARSKTTERYVREWLMNQAAGGYVEYDAAKGTFTLPPEQAMALADRTSPAYLHGAFDILLSMTRDVSKIERAFKTGDGVPWGDHDGCLFCGTERFFRPNYAANLVSSWIPALDGMEPRLRAGAAVADVGCGHGASTVIMAKAYPSSRFVGFDSHAPSITAAQRAAQDAGATNATFHVASSTDFPGNDYDLVACFDCLHDMGDPNGAAAHVFDSLGKDGTWMIVEPRAGDRPEDNLNPVGRIFYAASTMICVPASLAYGGPALGAQAGEAKLTEVIKSGGFKRVRRAAETPFNMVLEARK